MSGACLLGLGSSLPSWPALRTVHELFRFTMLTCPFIFRFTQLTERRELSQCQARVGYEARLLGAGQRLAVVAGAARQAVLKLIRSAQQRAHLRPAPRLH